MKTWAGEKYYISNDNDNLISTDKPTNLYKALSGNVSTENMTVNVSHHHHHLYDHQTNGE